MPDVTFLRFGHVKLSLKWVAINQASSGSAPVDRKDDGHLEAFQAYIGLCANSTLSALYLDKIGAIPANDKFWL